MSPTGRRCASTGLWLNTGFTTGYRVARTTYGGLNPPTRVAGSDRQGWGRYDTPGSTVYLAGEVETAFREVIAPFTLGLQGNSALQKDADFLGMPLPAFIRDFKSYWEESSYMNTGCLPTQWRTSRDLYQVQVPASEAWVDIEHPSSLAAIRSAIGAGLAADTGIDSVSLAEVHAPDREVTTRIAEWLRTLVLDDGRQPAGVTYSSKLGGRCYAYWLRRRDEGLGEDHLRVVSTKPIDRTDPSLKTACKGLDLHCF
ncbi:RES domain-containing protein [Arthrobacter sp. H14]|uniref:RES domain-containing protein n=1 Tax=Arthrobacter sp. H14 TaxID=1312959 RepID=UPI00068733D0|nr:RES domain-containing protein [Arthrobacter sp. H14]